MQVVIQQPGACICTRPGRQSVELGPAGSFLPATTCCSAACTLGPPTVNTRYTVALTESASAVEWENPKQSGHTKIGGRPRRAGGQGQGWLGGKRRRSGLRSVPSSWTCMGLGGAGRGGEKRGVSGPKNQIGGAVFRGGKEGRDGCWGQRDGGRAGAHAPTEDGGHVESLHQGDIES